MSGHGSQQQTHGRMITLISDPVTPLCILTLLAVAVQESLGGAWAKFL